MSSSSGTVANSSNRGTRLWLLFTASLLMHFWSLGSPGAVVFDEYHFGKYVNAYCCTGEYFFDVHPPHGKLLSALILNISGYDGSQPFAHINEPLDRIDPTLLRLIPAVAGTLIPVAISILLLQLGASSWAALLGGWAALFENSLLLQSRILSLDSQLILATLLGLILALKANKSHAPPLRWMLAILAGAAAGFALGIKATGLATVVLVCVSLYGFWETPSRRRVLLPLLAIIGATAVYFSGWIAHFLLLTEPGPGDVWGSPTGNLLSDIFEIQRTTLGAHAGLQESHPYGSSWWLWPFMWRPIFYYGTEESALFLLGNPLIWWPCSLLTLWLGIRVISRITRKGLESLPRDPASISRYQLLLAFAAFWLPHMLISRVMFLYHYLPALVFAICLAALQLDRLGLGGNGKFQQLPLFTKLLFILVPAGFLLTAPFTFGWDVPTGFLSWLHGFARL